ncbi:uncharacterized protein [Montipora capricornis]|uniref:uncharacterized protein n=1 Tax=Montipora capricornis TaxID=246305 RepID=UPI0035F1EA9C
MARYASEEQTNVVYEEELKPRIAEASEFIDEDNDDDDDDDDDDSHSDDSDGHDNDDYDDSKDAQNTSQSTQNTVAASGDDKQKSKSRFRHVKALGSKMRSVLPNMKTKQATIQKLQHKIRELEDKNVLVQSKMRQMRIDNMNMEAVIKERDGLQADVTHLQSRIEDLMTKLEEIKRREHIAECIKLNHISGMLWKRGVLGLTGRMWRHRWFTASNDGRLYYYNAIPRGFIDIKNITEVQDWPSSAGYCKKSCFNVVTPKRTFEIRAKDEEEKERWLNALDHLRYWTKEEASFNEGKNIRCTENH